MPARRRCLVFGCGNSTEKRFCFPRSVKALEWKKFCQNPKLDGMHYTKLHSRFSICYKHFEEKCFTYPSSGKLLRNALPTLFPPPLPKEVCLESVPDVGQWSPRSPSPDSSQLFEESRETDERTFTFRISERSSLNIERRHMIDELPEVYTNITLPYLEKQPMYVKWVYDIINGEADQDRVVFQCPCKDDKDGFFMIRDIGWDGENLDGLHLIALPYRPGLLTMRDLRASHLPLLRNIYTIGKAVIEEKYRIPGSQLRIFLQYLPSFYHLNVHFTMVDEEIYGTHVGRAHLLYSVMNNLMLCPNYYEVANLQFYVEESHELFGNFGEYGLVGRIRKHNLRLTS